MFHLNTKICLTMLGLSGFDLYSIWVPLKANMFATGDVFKMLVFYPVLVHQYAQYGHVLCMCVFFRSQYVSTLSTAMFYVCWYFIRSQYVSTLSTAMFYVCWYFFRSRYVSTLSAAMFSCMLLFFRCQYVCTLSTAMFYVSCYFFRSQDVSTLSTAMFSCMLLFFFGLSMLVRLVRLCSMYVCIFVGFGTLVRLVQPCSHVCWYIIRSQYVKSALQGCVLCMFVFLTVLVRQYAQYSHVLMHVAILFGLSTLSTANCSIFIRMHAWLSSALPQSTACNKGS